jgi:CRISPR system Cascade subunit CasA
MIQAETLNLITDQWIPVRTATGSRLIRPDQVADPDVLGLDWPRPDLNIACLELLIGLIYLSDPPADEDEWESRKPDPERLRARLAPYVPAFNLGGDGPRFLQDRVPLPGDPNPVDMLFIDSAGGQAAKNNSDLMVRRGRYSALPAGLAAMALYTLQAYAPAGGSGHRTSMRGGGPMVTLIDPGGTLWDLLWANVPHGAPQSIDTLPWMRPTRTSEKGKLKSFPPETEAPSAEVFFGMPRRLRLCFEDGVVTGVVRQTYGTNYAGWRHPLTPYYRMEEGEEALPVHPKAGTFGYRNWLGVVMDGKSDGLRIRAETLNTFHRRVRHATPRLIIAGWAMGKATPLDFTWSSQPLPMVDALGARLIRGMVEAADLFARALRDALKPVCRVDDAGATMLEALREAFYLRTEPEFHAAVSALERGEDRAKVARVWLDAMRRTAIGLYEDRALPGLEDRRMKEVEAILKARGYLLAAFAGRSKAGGDAFGKLELDPPETTRKKETA